MKKRAIMSSVVVAGLAMVFAFVYPATSHAVTIGQWTTDLGAAKAKAISTGAPLLVVFSLQGCGICAAFDAELFSAAATSYFDRRGLVMVYVKAAGPNAVSSWAGPHGEGLVPLVRITWFDGSATSFKADYNWYRPGSFAALRGVVESKIRGYVYGSDYTPPDGGEEPPDPVETTKLAAATYNGWVGALGTNGVQGTISFSVTSAGTITGKAVFPNTGLPYGGAYTVKNGPKKFTNGVAYVTSLVSQGTKTLPLNLQIALEDGRVTGKLGSGDAELPVELYRDDWSKPDEADIASQYE